MRVALVSAEHARQVEAVGQGQGLRINLRAADDEHLARKRGVVAGLGKRARRSLLLSDRGLCSSLRNLRLSLRLGLGMILVVLGLRGSQGILGIAKLGKRGGWLVLLAAGGLMGNYVLYLMGLRLLSWEWGWQQFLAHPLLGIGVANFRATVDAAVAAGALPEVLRNFNGLHNLLVDHLTTTGLVGTLAMLGFWVGMFLYFRAVRRRADGPRWRVCFQAALPAWGS